MSDMKHLLDIVEEFSEEEALVEAQDSFDIELGEDLIIETGVVDITEDGIIVEGDEETLRLLAEHGVILEETDWSKYDEPTVDRIKKGITKPVDRTDYNTPPAMRDPDQGKPGYEKRRSLIMKGLEQVAEDEPEQLGLPLPKPNELDMTSKQFVSKLTSVLKGIVNKFRKKFPVVLVKDFKLHTQSTGGLGPMGSDFKMNRERSPDYLPVGIAVLQRRSPNGYPDPEAGQMFRYLENNLQDMLQQRLGVKIGDYEHPITTTDGYRFSFTKMGWGIGSQYTRKEWTSPNLSKRDWTSPGTLIDPGTGQPTLIDDVTGFFMEKVKPEKEKEEKIDEAERDYGNLTVKDINSLAHKAGLTNGIRPYHANLAELVVRYCKKHNTNTLPSEVIIELGWRSGMSEMEPWDIKFAKLVADACMKGMPKDPLGLDEKMVMGLPGDQGSKVMGEMSMDKVTINGKPVNIRSIEVDGVDTRDAPDFSDSYATYAEFADGTPLSDEELKILQDKHGDVVYQVVYDSLFEAEYQGRKVPLGKPMKGDVKKSKVYVRKPNGKVVKVNFGDKKMKIKKSNPKRRKSFRARHNCKNPGPRWKARYWSCRAW